MKITGIIKKDGLSYTLGEPAEVGEAFIERIVYKRDGNLFNSGLTNSEAAYVVYSTDTPIAHIVPEREVREIYFDTTKEGKKKKTSAADDDTPDDFLDVDDDEQTQAA